MSRKDVNWKIIVHVSRETAFSYFATDEGRRSFWAEEAQEKEGWIDFRFPNLQAYCSKILLSEPSDTWSIDYFGSPLIVQFTTLHPNSTIISIQHQSISDREYNEVSAGWVSVLMNLKSVIDHQIDLRNHDPNYCWDQGFVNN